MAVITLCSASGSPGVTTTAVGLALCWPRPVLLVEADPRGTSTILSGFFQGAREYDGGLVELALSPLETSDALREVVRPLAGQATFVAGTRSYAQALGLKELWGRLSEALDNLEETGQDVIVDAGPLGFPGSPEALLSLADLTLLVTRSHLPALFAARSWTEALHRDGHAWQHPGLLLVGAGQPYTAREAGRLLGLPVVASIADDAEAAAVYHRGARAPRKFSQGPYIRSLRAAVDAIGTTVSTRRKELLREVTP
ncbi:hypothetical protein ET495_10010 [Xylanimonas allomyrinae]|uniref:ParA family protein n=1 Tax=Xylanimonas allomyrinae TaxID=2509459 RepID=A0A4P6EMH6_9MICO|nr:hypothetical protein [Xylanimonas allomyrinae]QAY63526.1 hypothetical protein ET495_10010 [Xylanimonas allomyrinae]